MARFMFRLAGVLKLREAVRDERRAFLAEAERLVASLAARLTEIEQERIGLRHERKQPADPARVDIERLLRIHRYDETLQGEQHRVAARLETARADAERRRQGLIEAERDMRALERLHDNQRRCHDDATARREQRELDDARSMRGDA